MSLLVPRDRATIQARYLARRRGRYAARGVALETGVGSPEWLLASALAVMVEGLEAHGAAGLRQLHPDQAVGGMLSAHGDVLQLPRAAGERDADYQGRLAARWQERLPAGSPAEWVAACEAVTGVTDAYAYARLRPGTAGTFTLGCSTIVVRGAAQGDSPTNTRIASGAVLAHVAAYLVGAEDAAGVAVTDGTELRPVCAQVGNVSVEAISESVQNVEAVLTNAPTHPFPWTGSHAIVASTTGTITILGSYEDLAGLPLLANVGTTVYRGGYHRATVTTAVFGGVNTVLTLAAALDAAPTGTVYPAPPNFEALRLRVLDLFDRLTPGDTNVNASRHPSVADAPATLYLAALDDALLNGDGVIAATYNAPAADTVPAAKAQATLGTLLMVSA